MDRTAPAILILDLNHVPGTAAAPFSVEVRSADQIPVRTGCFPSTGKLAMPPSVDAADIPENITAAIACTAAGTVLRFISRLAPVVETAGAQPGHVPNKGEGK
jgi:hypothetical protein